MNNLLNVVYRTDAMPGPGYIPVLDATRITFRTGGVEAEAASSPPTTEKMMNWDVIEQNWPQYKIQVRAQWGKLTGSHLDAIAGNREQLANGIQEAYGVGRAEADMQIKSFQKFLKESGSY